MNKHIESILFNTHTYNVTEVQRGSYSLEAQTPGGPRIRMDLESAKISCRNQGSSVWATDANLHWGLTVGSMEWFKGTSSLVEFSYKWIG